MAYLKLKLSYSLKASLYGFINYNSNNFVVFKTMHDTVDNKFVIRN